MKKLLLLTKTLLAVALLCVGQNAWGEDAYTPVYTKALSGWTSDDVSSTEWVATNVTPTISTDASKGLCCSGAPGGGYTVKKTFSVTANAKVKYEGVWNVNRVTGRDANFCYIQFGDKIRISVPNGGQFYLNTDGTSSTSTSITGVKNTTKNVEARAFSIIFDTSTKTVESFIFSGTDLTSQVSGIIAGDFNSFTIGYARSGSGSSENNLTSISVSECKQTVTNVDYTINYQLSGTTVKTVEGASVVDAEITADVAIDGTEEGYVGKHYLITAGSAPSMTLVADAASNVLNVPVRAPYTATLTVTKNIGGEAQTPEVTNLIETDAKVCSWIYAYPMYVEKGGVYYVADVTSTFGESGNFTNGESISKTVNYKNAAPDVVWFKDINAGSVSNVVYSGGSYTNTNEQLANVTVDAGLYEVIFNVVSKAGSGSSHRNEGVSVNDVNVANLTGNVNGLRSLIINVANDESVITAYGNGSSSYTDNLDYVLIKKAPATVSKTITSAGYATYCSPYALDFSKEEDLKAYIITGTESGSTLALTQVTSVPANTGILLQGPAAEYTIPVVASSSTDVSANKLVGVLANTVKEAESIYVLMDETAGVGFYKNNNEFTVGANTAYLPANFASLARSAFFFGGNITGVENVEAAKAKAKEGKFIENGKLVIVKNGQKFNAAGAKLY